jgi:glycosyltransferase involved in cell wall biosynthesis
MITGPADKTPLAITVLIATHNRAGQLRESIDAVLRQRTPASLRWELLVVDNASTDRTREVIRAAVGRASVPVRYLFEGTLGKSRALNVGLAAASGSVIALTDDDVSPADDWVATAAVALDRWGVDGAGGRILPRWEVEPPAWVLESRRLLDSLAIMEFDEAGMMPVPGSRHPQVWGANMVFRRDALLALGGFDVRLGPVGGKRHCEEDIDMVRRVLESGRRVVYDPALTVFHRVPRSRLRPAYFRRIMWDMGEGSALVAPLAPGGRRLFGVPRWRLRHLACLMPRAIWSRLSRRPDAFDDVLNWSWEAGLVWGYLKRAARERGRSLASVLADPISAAQAMRPPR